MIKFSSKKEEIKIIDKIANRAIGMFNFIDKFTMFMDIDACHSNNGGLKLLELLQADDLNFSHDIVGIINNINRETGKLENCFMPRYSN